MKRVKARKDEISGKSRTGVESSLRSTKNVTVYQGSARFESPGEVSVGAARLTANRIFINVGGRAVVPDLPGLSEVAYLTNSSMMSVDFLPRHLRLLAAVISAWNSADVRRFGSQVTIVEMGPRFVQREEKM
jgi:pyruvate/2-oxoglutarate dehydrogenase complex dihydrolipoamide dehydrogenase (E3) component